MRGDNHEKSITESLTVSLHQTLCGLHYDIARKGLDSELDSLDVIPKSRWDIRSEAKPQISWDGASESVTWRERFYATSAILRVLRAGERIACLGGIPQQLTFRVGVDFSKCSTVLAKECVRQYLER